MLAVLLSKANQPVPMETLIDELWPDRPPQSYPAVLQGRISALRKLLCPDLPARSAEHVLRTRHGCYLLDVDPRQFDATEFIRLTEDGRDAAEAGEYLEADHLLRTGLALWRGSALQDTGRGPLLSGYAGGLEERRLAALEQGFGVDIALGRLPEAITGLTELLNRDPSQENIAALLVDALVKVGRRTDAKAVFDSTRSALAGLGAAPGARLRWAQTLLDPVPKARPLLMPEAPARPAQLPPRLPDFVGRAELLDRIRAELTGPYNRLVLLSGPGGVGKSTLAVRAAHLVRREFDGGQVAADLTAEPGQPAEVLRRFLLALGVDEESVPVGFLERQQLWRSRTADARVLVLLDGARDEAQVRALLPGGSGCAVLVTARRRMLGLAGAVTIGVGAFTGQEAHELLTRIVGADRVAGAPAAAETLLGHCAGLPLAVRIVGAKLGARPHETIDELATRIGAGRSRLAELRAGDLDVRATIGLSYAECGPQPRRALRLLAALGLPAVSRAMISRLLESAGQDTANTEKTDSPEKAADTEDAGRDAAEALVEAQLLQVRGRDAFDQVRYQPHDLIAEFARERAELEETPRTLDRALRGMLDFALDGAGSAAAKSSLALWSGEEAENVVALLYAALRRGWWTRAWTLADTFGAICETRPGLRSAHSATVLGLVAARWAGDSRSAAVSLRRLGNLHWHQARAGTALRYFRAAANRFTALGDEAELGHTLVLKSDVLAETGRAAEAREILTEALTLAEKSGDHQLHGVALDQFGCVFSDAGEFDSADRCFLGALRLAREFGDERSAVSAIKRRADLLRRQGRYDQSGTLLHEALVITRRLGDPHWEAHVLRSLGETQRYTGYLEDAGANLRRSLELFTEHGHRHAVAYSLRGLADLHAQLRAYEPAAEALARCRTLFESLGDRRGQAYTLRSLGALHVRTGRLADAEQALTDALAISEALSLRWFARDVARALNQVRNSLRAE